MKSETILNIQRTIDMLSAMTGEYVWFVRCVDDHILRLEFGEPHLTVREPQDAPAMRAAVRAALDRRIVVPTGQWHLFVENGLWSVNTKYFHCNRTEANAETISKCLSSLEGQKLNSVSYNTSSDEWSFEFDLSGLLTIKSCQSDPAADQWTVFYKDGRYLSYVSKENIVLGSDPIEPLILTASPA